jgi:hypothetical protein
MWDGLEDKMMFWVVSTTLNTGDLAFLHLFVRETNKKCAVGF